MVVKKLVMGSLVNATRYKGLSFRYTYMGYFDSG